MITLATCVAVTIMGLTPHPPFAKPLGQGGKPKLVFENGDIQHIEGFVWLVDGNDAIAIQITSEAKKEVKSFPTYYHLRAGRSRPGVSEAGGYRLKDVRVGDIVSIGLVSEGKQQFCVDICIFKRPGGLVPPSPVVNPELKVRYHDMRNKTIAEKADPFVPKK